MLKDARAYKIILDTKLYEEVSNRIGKTPKPYQWATSIDSLSGTGSDDRSSTKILASYKYDY